MYPAAKHEVQESMIKPNSAERRPEVNLLIDKDGKWSKESEL